MTPEDVLAIARQGNPKVIAAIINRTTEPHGIFVRIARRGSCLYVLVEGQVEHQQEALVSFIKASLHKLQLQPITSAIVYGRQKGEASIAWNQQIKLPQMPISSATSDPFQGIPPFTSATELTPPLAPNHDRALSHQQSPSDQGATKRAAPQPWPDRQASTTSNAQPIPALPTGPNPVINPVLPSADPVLPSTAVPHSVVLTSSSVPQSTVLTDEAEIFIEPDLSKIGLADDISSVVEELNQDPPNRPKNDPVALDPVALDPVALDHITLDPVALDPVALDHITLDHIALELDTLAPPETQAPAIVAVTPTWHLDDSPDDEDVIPSDMEQVEPSLSDLDNPKREVLQVGNSQQTVKPEANDGSLPITTKFNRLVDTAEAEAEAESEAVTSASERVVLEEETVEPKGIESKAIASETPLSDLIEPESGNLETPELETPELETPEPDLAELEGETNLDAPEYSPAKVTRQFLSPETHPPQSPLAKGGSSGPPPLQGGVRGGSSTLQGGVRGGSSTAGILPRGCAEPDIAEPDIAEPNITEPEVVVIPEPDKASETDSPEATNSGKEEIVLKSSEIATEEGDRIQPEKTDDQDSEISAEEGDRTPPEKPNDQDNGEENESGTAPDLDQVDLDAFIRYPEALVLIFFTVAFFIWQAYMAILENAAPQGSLTASQLANRLGVSRTTISRRKQRDDFFAWTQSQDPDGLGWIYTEGFFVPSTEAL